MSDSLARLRIASRFSLWTWAVYWPGSGLVLLAGGMRDPVSLVVVAGSLLGFTLLAASGGVPATASTNMREFLLERPLYVIGGVAVLAVLGTVFDPLHNIGLALFSGLFLAAILLTGWRLWQHVRAQRLELVASRADQVFIALALGLASSLLIFLDAVLPMIGFQPTPSVSNSVVAVNLLSLGYPPLLLLAMRPFREPLRNPFGDRLAAPKPQTVAPEPVPQPVEG